MYFEEAEIPKSVRNSNVAKDMLDDFISSGYMTAEVFADDFNNDINNLRLTLLRTVAKYKMPIEVIMRNGRVFVRRKL